MERTSLSVVLVCVALVAGSCGGDDASPGACGPSNCQGCCDSNGACINATTSVSTAATCGLGGAACVACGADERCANGQCASEPCGPDNCTGCCQNNQCIETTGDAACGSGGTVCVTCSSDEQCVAGACKAKPCGPITCASGCCFNGACLPGTNSGACGTGGSTCQDCAPGICENQQCKSVTCDATTCASGCCTAQGACVPGTSEAACGTGGGACKTCGNTEACKNQVCTPTSSTCNASSCPNGCCDSQGNCAAGNTNSACGTGGNPCSTCGSSQACVSGKCTCNATSCAAGCCEGDYCKPGHLDTSCGTGGAACQQCGTGTSCVAGQCQAGCSYTSCPDGCCEGSTCKSGDDPAACGDNASPCKQCATTWEKCTFGTCNDSLYCNSTTCQGCCKDSQCQPGTSDSACGTGGQVCFSCPPHKICSKTKCTIKTTSKWTVTLVQVEVDATKSYDYAFPTAEYAKPDIYVELTVGSQVKTSKVVTNSYNPVFNEYLLTATAAELMGTIKIRIWDEDPLDPDDPIADCTDTFYETELENGMATIYYCGTSPDLKKIQFSFNPVI
jgi:hypothetical protein